MGVGCRAVWDGCGGCRAVWGVGWVWWVQSGMGGEVGVVGAEQCGVWGGCGGCRVAWGVRWVW